ncbi:MAG: glycosyltransferase [Clostridia bacterium]|nr:glycosyltransferase [Clostridia bacterium]
MKPNVSIIIIAFNDEAHVEKAIQSARSQFLENIEIICVDDGSKDNTLQVMRRIAAEDNRIKVETQSNGGTLSARYLGVQAVTAEYVMFLDSDDTLEPEAAELLYQEAETKRLDILEFGVHIVEDKANPPSKEMLDFFARYFSDDRPSVKGLTRGELIYACFGLKNISWNVWNKLVRTERMKEAYAYYRGEYINMAEDMLLTLMLLSVTSRYERINTKLYNYSCGGGMSTANSDISSSARVKLYGEVSLLLRLQKEWMEQMPNPPSNSEAGIGAFRRQVNETFLGNLLYSCAPSKRKEMLEWIGAGIPQKDFFEALMEYLYVDKRFPVEDAVVALRGSLVTKPTIKEVKTVGMYYYRLYNGGIERVMSLLSVVLKRAGYRVVIVTEEGPTDLDYPLPEDVWHVRLGKGFSSELERAAHWQTVIEDEKIDAMIYHSWLDPNLLLDSLAIKSTGASLLVHTHSSADFALTIPDHRWARQDRVYALADCIVTLSEIDRAWWKALGYRCASVPNPCTFDLEKVKPVSLESQDVLWVGRLDPMKQYEEAFEIAEIVHRELPDFRLHILGKAETQEETDRIVNSLYERKMYSYIIYEGFTQNVLPYYKRASVLLSTSSCEGFPMTFLESKAHGIPMVAYDLPYVDMVRHPRGILVVPQKDRMAAARKIIALLKNPSLRDALGQEARHSVEDFYRVPLEEVWQGILNGAVTVDDAQEDPARENLRMAMSRAFDVLEVGKEKQPVIKEVPVEVRVPSEPIIVEVPKQSVYTEMALQELLRIAQIRSMRLTHFFRRTVKQGFNRDRAERKAYRRWLWTLLRRKEDETKLDHRYNPLYNVIGMLEQDVKANNS